MSSSDLDSVIEQWLRWDPDPDTRKEVEEMRAAGATEALNGRFKDRIKFGTAGLRGRMQAGPSSLNLLTVLQASQGLAKRLEKEFQENPAANIKRAVCIGRDGRHYSERFAKIAASAFIKKNIPVYYISGVCPTPLVAYCVKHLNLAAGVMVTASHNPKDDNGYKVYWQRGSQIVPPIDAEIQQSIMENQEPWEDVSETFIDSYKGDLLLNPMPDIWDAYVAEVCEKCCFYKAENKTSPIPIVFTAMHGVGKRFVSDCFEAFGLNPYIPVLQQIDPDPDFPTVPFPNPEEGKGALELAILTADANNAPVIIANDPDSDRLAAAEKLPNGEWKIFTGNELGILFAHWTWTNYKAQHPEVDPAKCIMMNTTVSSKMLKGMADKEGFQYEETLTGFKWLGTLAQQKMDEGLTFLYCFEEAIGFLVHDVCLDKDGVRAAGMFAEMANYLYRQNKTIVQLLDSLYDQYGYYRTLNRYFFCYDPVKMRTVFTYIRQMNKEEPEFGYPRKVGRFPVKNVRDLTTGFDDSQPDNKAILPTSSSSDMITFYFENGAVVTLRGSGTEPKLKYYCELNGTDRQQVDSDLTELVEGIINDLLRPSENGLEPPAD